MDDGTTSARQAAAHGAAVARALNAAGLRAGRSDEPVYVVRANMTWGPTVELVRDRTDRTVTDAAALLETAADALRAAGFVVGAPRVNTSAPGCGRLEAWKPAWGLHHAVRHHLDDSRLSPAYVVAVKSLERGWAASFEELCETARAIVDGARDAHVERPGVAPPSQRPHAMVRSAELQRTIDLESWCQRSAERDLADLRLHLDRHVGESGAHVAALRAQLERAEDRHARSTGRLDVALAEQALRAVMTAEERAELFGEQQRIRRARAAEPPAPVGLAPATATHTSVTHDEAGSRAIAAAALSI